MSNLKFKEACLYLSIFLFCLSSSQLRADASQDTIPLMDTTVIFNMQTFEERFIVVERETEEFIKPAIDVSETMITDIDTTVIFDPDTYKESVVYSHVELPENYQELAMDLEEVIKRYGSKSTFKIESQADKPILDLSFARGHKGFTSSLKDENGQLILNAKIPAASLKQDFSKGLSLAPGNYTFERSDQGQTVEIVLR